MLIEELPESERICKNCALQSSEDCALCYSPQHRSFVESGTSVRTRAEKLVEELGSENAELRRERDEAQEKYSRCYSELVSTAKRLSLAERDLLDAQRERNEAQESLASIEVYASDTLSGRVEEPETVKWHRDAMAEVLGRAAGARLRDGA